jgi:hypothetical protein
MELTAQCRDRKALQEQRVQKDLKVSRAYREWLVIA